VSGPAVLAARDVRLVAAANEEVTEVATEVMREELRPIIREALTEDVMRSISQMVQLLPAAVEALGNDLASDEGAARRNAAKLLMQYTLGNPSVAPQGASTAPVTVVFPGMPRPDGAPPPAAHPDAAAPPVEATVVEDPPRECDVCHEPKTDADFVGASDRCHECHAKMRADLQKLLGSATDGEGS
jgi:hypothetical protein